METSEAFNEAAAALCKAQRELGKVVATETATIPGKEGKRGYEYTYADLASVLSVCRKPFADNGLAIVQSPSSADGLVTVSTRLIHTSGQWIGTTLSLRPTNATPQAIGSAITYARRYSLLALAGIAPEDDDGQDAQGGRSPHTPEPRRQDPKPDPEPPKEETVGEKHGKALVYLGDVMANFRAGKITHKNVADTFAKVLTKAAGTFDGTQLESILDAITTHVTPAGAKQGDVACPEEVTQQLMRVCERIDRLRQPEDPKPGE